MHYVDKGYEPGKFDVYIQGQLLLNPEYGKTEVYKLNLKLVVNGQAGEVGVMNGQVKFKCGDCDFHLIAHYSNGEGWCKVVPVEPV